MALIVPSDYKRAIGGGNHAHELDTLAVLDKALPDAYNGLTPISGQFAPSN